MKLFKIWSESYYGTTEVEADYFDVEGNMLFLYTTNTGKVAAYRDWAHIEEVIEDED